MIVIIIIGTWVFIIELNARLEMSLTMDNVGNIIILFAGKSTRVDPAPHEADPAVHKQSISLLILRTELCKVIHTE